jgi:hypothetical protein
MGASTSLVEPILKTWGDIAITVVLMASPATYTGERNADLANDIVEPEPVEEVVEATPEDDICDNITGYNPACGNPVSVEWVSFGSARPITYSGAQFGSDGTSSKQFYNVPSAGILVHDMKMSSEAVSGRVSFGPSGNINGVNLRLWISASPDGPMLNSACGYVGYVEAMVRFSTDGSLGCNLNPGGQYYMNLAICRSVPRDLYCNDPGATTPANDARLVMSPDY